MSILIAATCPRPPEMRFYEKRNRKYKINKSNYKEVAVRYLTSRFGKVCKVNVTPKSFMPSLHHIYYQYLYEAGGTRWHLSWLDEKHEIVKSRTYRRLRVLLNDKTDYHLGFFENNIFEITRKTIVEACQYQRKRRNSSLEFNLRFARSLVILSEFIYE